MRRSLSFINVCLSYFHLPQVEFFQQTRSDEFSKGTNTFLSGGVRVLAVCSTDKTCVAEDHKQKRANKKCRYPATLANNSLMRVDVVIHALCIFNSSACLMCCHYIENIMKENITRLFN